MDSDATKLRVLANWFDEPSVRCRFPEWDDVNDDVQQDLRQIANRLENIEDKEC